MKLLARSTQPLRLLRRRSRARELGNQQRVLEARGWPSSRCRHFASCCFSEPVKIDILWRFLFFYFTFIFCTHCAEMIVLFKEMLYFAKIMARVVVKQSSLRALVCCKSRGHYISVVLTTQTLCIPEHLFKDKLGAKSAVFSIRM